MNKLNKPTADKYNFSFYDCNELIDNGLYSKLIDQLYTQINIQFIEISDQVYIKSI